MRYALIKSSLVENIILIEDESLLANFSSFDYVIDVTNLRVGIGWIYDGDNFVEVDLTSVDDDSGPLP